MRYTPYEVVTASVVRAVAAVIHGPEFVFTDSTSRTVVVSYIRSCIFDIILCYTADYWERSIGTAYV